MQRIFVLGAIARLLRPVDRSAGARSFRVRLLQAEAGPSQDATDDYGLEALTGLKELKSVDAREVVLLDFWGTWCGPCVKKLPEVQALHEQFQGKGLVVIGVHTQ